MKNHTFRSAILAIALTLGTSATLTIGHSLVAPTAAQAGVISGLKNAAKTIGGGVKKAAVTVGTAGKNAGVGVASHVKRGAIAVAKSPVGDGVKEVGKVLRVPQAASAVKKAVVKVVR